jgi:hypothetical protein
VMVPSWTVERRLLLLLLLLLFLLKLLLGRITQSGC